MLSEGGFMKKLVLFLILVSVFVISCSIRTYAYTTWEDNYYDYYNKNNLPLQLTPDLFRFSDSNPFWINIKGTKYYMIKSRSDGNYTYKDILGYDLTKKRLFEPLFDLESDGDNSKLTGEELAKAGIRFVAVKTNGKLSLNDKSRDFPLEKVSYIDMNKLTVSSRSALRPYGSFSMYIKRESGSLQKYIGHVDYQRPKDLERLF